MISPKAVSLADSILAKCGKGDADGAHKSGRMFPAYTTAELKAGLSKYAKDDPHRKKMEDEIARRESGESKPFSTPQAPWGKKDAAITPGGTFDPSASPVTGGYMLTDRADAKHGDAGTAERKLLFLKQEVEDREDLEEEAFQKYGYSSEQRKRATAKLQQAEKELAAYRKEMQAKGDTTERADAQDRTGKEVKNGNRVEHTDGRLGSVLSVGNETVRVEWDDGYKQTVTNPTKVLMVLR